MDQRLVLFVTREV